jgi:Raf kinase inhibitor-like YbhB/YbcL family protein
MTLRLTSSAFVDGTEIPSRFTCEGDDLSPPLSWSTTPTGTRSLALIVDDPDAPDPAAPRMTWVHWVLYNLAPDAGGLPEGVPATTPPAGSSQGQNDWHRPGYNGPCPPIGQHRYFFKLYALDRVLSLSPAKATKAALEAAMRGHVLAEATLVGTYQKHRK